MDQRIISEKKHDISYKKQLNITKKKTKKFSSIHNIQIQQTAGPTCLKLQNCYEKNNNEQTYPGSAT